MRKIISVLNKSIEPGVVMNALAHMSFGMGASAKQDPALMNYETSSGEELPNISKRPYIVLRTTGNKVKSLVRLALEEGIEFTTFTEAMTQGTWEDQKKRSQEISFDNQVFYGVTLFGESEKVTALTKKFSLWK